MDKGISNIKIEKSFNDEQNEDLKENYMGVYSIDSIMRYIRFYEIIKRETLNTHLKYLIQMDIINPEHNGGVLWTFTEKII